MNRRTVITASIALALVAFAAAVLFWPSAPYCSGVIQAAESTFKKIVSPDR